MFFGDIMKKVFTLILSVALCFVAFLGGCSCAPESPLSFSNAFYGEASSPSVGYKETLTYNVCYVNDKEAYPYCTMDNTSKAALDGVDYKGTFVTEFEVMSSYPSSLPKTDILGDKGIYSGEVYRYKTKLEVEATYTLKGGEVKEFNDSVITEVYFLPAAHSFAPLYSSRLCDMNLVFITGKKAEFSRVNYDFKTTYNYSSYTIDSKVKTSAQETTKTNTHGYSFKTIIDNNQLLFAIRNFQTPSNTTVAISLVDPTYSAPASVGFNQRSSINEDFDFSFNGQSALDAEKLPVRNVIFAMNNIQATGFNHYLKMQVQESTGATVKNRALLVQYASPLVAYSSISCLGVMQYDLVSVSTNN